MNMNGDRLWRFHIPKFDFLSSQNMRTAGVYSAGGLFSLGFFFFLDAAIFSKTANASDIHIKFVDWIPIICSGFGMLVINSIEKSQLTSEAFSPSRWDGGTAWKARLVLFLGFALMAGGLAGSVTVLTLKYLVPQYPFPTMYLGVANVIGNALIMLSSAVLWVSQNIEDDFQYNLSL